MDQNNIVMELLSRVIELENRVSTLEEKMTSLQGQIPTVRPRVSKKYMPITKYLENCRDDVVVMSFDQIEEMLRNNGANLPPSAYAHQAFWANSDTHSIALSWLAAGFEVDHVDRDARMVSFKRKEK